MAQGRGEAPNCAASAEMTTAPRPHPLAWLVALGLSAVACGDAAVDRVADAAAPLAAPGPPPTPSPQAVGPTPTTAPAAPDRLVLSGDVSFEDLDPEVVLTRTGERYQIELRHRGGGSAAPDSTLVLAEVPAVPGTYAVRGPGAAGSRQVSAFLTSRTERLGTMKDFTASVQGTLTLREQAPGLLAGELEVALQEAPPPPPVVLEGAPTPAPNVGTMPTPPPAQVRANGAFLILLADARPAPSEPPPLPTPAATAAAASTPNAPPPAGD
jgi:hypothetical protein